VLQTTHKARLCGLAAIFACFVILASSLSACGGDDDGKKSTTPTTVDPVVLRKDSKKLDDLIAFTNTAYQGNTAAGLKAVASTNYDVYAKRTSVDACLQHIRRNLGYLAGSRFEVVLEPGSVEPADAKTVTAFSYVQGRLYKVKLDVTINFPNGAEPVSVKGFPATFVIAKDGGAWRADQCVA
jgi:hypothetical protein